MSALGHDIRNALTPILLAADCLDDVDDDLRAAVERIVDLAGQVDRDAAAHEGTREALALALRRIEALETNNAKTREQRDNEAWMHAACLSIAEGIRGWDEPPENDSLAMRKVRQLRRDFESARALLAKIEHTVARQGDGAGLGVRLMVERYRKGEGAPASTGGDRSTSGGAEAVGAVSAPTPGSAA